MNRVYVSDENLYNMEKVGIEIKEEANITTIKRKENDETILEVIFCDENEILLQKQEDLKWVAQICGVQVTSNVLVVYYRKDGTENMEQYKVSLK